MDLWQYLHNTAKPIVLYGTGSGADRALDRLNADGTPVAGVFASDGFAKGRSFRGFRVETYENIKNRLVRCIFEIRALQIEGEYPGASNEQRLLEDTRYALEFITKTPINRLFSFSLSSEVLAELDRFTLELRKKFIDRPLKSLEMLSAIEKE